MNAARRNIKTTLAILRDEERGDVAAALKKMAAGYSMTWVYKSRKGVLFPRTNAGAIKKKIAEAYAVRGRKYAVRHIVGDARVVMVELVESYPDPKTEKTYRTPLVLVLEFAGGKILRGRHYCDPRISFLRLSKQRIKKMYRAG